VTKTEGPSTATHYQPISCDVYSRLELAIMHRERLHLSWKQGNVWFTQPVVPTDLETRAGEEFLHCRLPSGEYARIRLDYIDRMEPA
jgi:Rho-binding antiterminator